MFAHPSVLPISSRQRWAPTGSVARLRKPLATLLLLVLLTQSAGPVFAASASPPPSSGQGQTAATPVSGSSASVPGAAPASPGKGEAPEGASSLLAGGPEGGTSPLTTFGVEAFQTDLFTGAATAEIPIVVPPGTAGVAPKVALRYHSGTVDDLRGTPTSDGLPPDQAQWTGLGWTLDIGGFIFRDTKGTVDPGDDTFKLGFGGAGHDLVLVDGTEGIYHTKDETFWRLQYDATADTWRLWTKDGTVHRFGGSDGSRGFLYPDGWTRVTYKYLLDRVTTPSGTEVRYAYEKDTATIPSTGRVYDQALYPTTISYTYHNDTLVGPTREVRFIHTPSNRTDWTDLSPYAQFFLETRRLDAIEVWVGTQFVRKYAFTYDYSVDRHPGYTWQGGAAGDLTLRSVTQYGTDNTSTLPASSFTYETAYLKTASNGIGGSVTFTYEWPPLWPLYSGCVVQQQGYPICADNGLRREEGPALDYSITMLLGYVLQDPLAGTLPLYSSLMLGPWGCEYGWNGEPDWGGRNDTACPVGATLLGYTFQTAHQGTRALYATSAWHTHYEWCEYVGSTSPGEALCGMPDVPLGYLHPPKVYRARVTTRAVSDGRGAAAQATFQYGQVAASADGTAFQGYDWVSTVDPAGHTAKTWFHQEDALKGRISKVETRSASGAAYTKVENTWATTSPATGVTFAKLTRTETSTCDGTTSEWTTSCKQAAQEFTYGDEYGNITSARYLGDLSGTGDERTEETQYAYNPALYLVGLAKTIRTLDHNDARVAQTWFYYDEATPTNPDVAPTQGRLKQKCQWLYQGTNPCVTMTYDDYGNVVTAADARGSTTTTVYETTYQTFPATMTSPPTANAPSGLTTTTTYDARFGVVLTATDANNATTSHAYDVFGRRTSTTNAVGVTQTISYDNFGSVATQHTTTTLAAGKPEAVWSKSYFDGLGRVYKAEKLASDGKVVLLETAYDARGLVTQKSLPRFEGDPLWTHFIYDPLGRPLLTTFPDNKTEAVAYHDWKVEVTDRAGRVHTSVKDAYGRTVQVVEPGDGGPGPATSYAYDALGRLTSVTDSLGHVTSMVYDSLGRKISMTELNMGTWIYEYDANGNLHKQTDQKGQTLTFTYDTLNRLVAKTYPGDASAARVALTQSSRTWNALDIPAYPGKICVRSGGACVGGDYRVGDSLDGPVKYLRGAPAPGTDTVPVHGALCYSNGVGCTHWGLTLDPNGPQLGFALTSDPGGGTALVQSGGLLLSGVTGTTTVYLAPTASGGTPRTDHVYTVDGSVPDEYTPQEVAIFVRQEPGAGTVPLHRYLNATTESNYYAVSGTPPAGYSLVGTLGHLETSAGEGRVQLYRHYNQTSGDYLLSTSEAPPGGYVSQGTLGYVYTEGSAPAAQPPVLYVYDLGENGKGRRTSMTDGAGTVTYAYDVLGRVTAVTRPVGGWDYTTRTTYTALGQVETVTYPNGDLVEDGEVVTYAYEAGQVTQVEGRLGATTTTYAKDIAYNAAGQLTSLKYGNDAVRTHTYDAATLRLTALQTTRGTTVLQHFTYDEYDDVGNLRTMKDKKDPEHEQTFTYTYDVLNRLRTATGVYGSEAYTYDAIGNLLTKGPEATPVTYTYGTTAQTCGRVMPHAVTGTTDGQTSKAYNYDCNGNLTSDGERTFTWNADNKPGSITKGGATTTFLYSGDGARLEKRTGNAAIRYAGGIEDHVSENATVKHIGVAGLTVALRVVGGDHPGVYYTHGDHLGSLNVLTDSTGAVRQRLTYRPFGETHENTGTDPGNVNFSTRRYTGQVEDPETGLYFYNARYYNPVLGRFVSPDSLVPEPGNPQSLNRYSYVENNPVTRIDPSGHGWFSSIFKPILRIAITIGMIAGSIVAGAFGHPEFIPLIMAAGSAAITALNGGSGQQVVLAAVAAGVTSMAGMGAGWAASTLPLNNVGSYVATGALLGAALGATGSAIMGQNVLRGALNGAISGAVIAAVSYGVTQYAQQTQSQAITRGPSAAQVTMVEGRVIADDPSIKMMLDQFEEYSGTSIRNVNEGGVPGSVGTATVTSGRAYLAAGWEDWDPSKIYTTLGHECCHISDARAFPGGPSNYMEMHKYFNGTVGHFQNPLEISAEMCAYRFALRYGVTPQLDPRYRIPMD